jgi:hypothetical protein
VIFPNQTPDALRRIVDAAIAFASAYFTDNLRRSNQAVPIADRRIDQVAIKEAYRDHDLAMTLDDLHHPYARDEILFYREETFPSCTWRPMAERSRAASPRGDDIAGVTRSVRGHS